MSQIPPNRGGSPNYATPPRPEDTVARIIPFRNGWALGAYYTGVFSIIPCVGAILGPVAVVLGIMGLRLANRNPNSKGKGHAWAGIIMGGIFGLAYIIAAVWFIMILIAEAKH